MRHPDKPLTERERRFCKFYLQKPVAKEAAIQAGYSAKSAKSSGSQILKRPHVQKYLDSFLTFGTGRIDVSADRTIQEIAAIAFCDIGKFTRTLENGEVIIDLAMLNKGDGRLVKEIIQEEFLDRTTKRPRAVRRTKLKFYEKMTALNLLARFFGIDRVGAGAQPGEPLQEKDDRPLHQRVKDLHRQGNGSGPKPH